MLRASRWVHRSPLGDVSSPGARVPTAVGPDSSSCCCQSSCSSSFGVQCGQAAVGGKRDGRLNHDTATLRLGTCSKLSSPCSPTTSCASNRKWFSSPRREGTSTPHCIATGSQLPHLSKSKRRSILSECSASSTRQRGRWPEPAAILDGRPVPAPPVSLQQSGERGEPAVDVDGDQPVYVGSRESFQSGWFGGGGVFGGLLMGSILGGFGGFVLDDPEPDGDESGRNE